MKILVPVQRVLDHNVKVRLRGDGSGVDLNGLKMSINPFDEVALEQAVRLREAGVATSVTAVACGPAVTQDVLRTAIAMGADSASLIASDAPVGPARFAALLRAFVAGQGFDLVLCGKQAIDDDLGALGPMLAGLLDWPQAVSVNALSVDGSRLDTRCDGDRGLERVVLALPAVLSVDLRLCEPRSIGLPNMMKARKAAIAQVPAAGLDGGTAADLPVSAVAEPPRRQPGTRAADLDALIARLRQLPALQSDSNPTP